VQNRLNLILETVANLLMELSPETYKSAAEQSARRAFAYDRIAQAGSKEYGATYQFPNDDPPAGDPLSGASEPKRFANVSKEFVKKLRQQGMPAPVRGVTDTITSDPAPQGRERTGVGPPSRRAASEARRGAKFFGRAARGYAARGEEMPNLDI